MRSMIGILASLLIGAGTANAQMTDVRLSVHAFRVLTNGAETLDVGGSAAATIGKTIVRIFSFVDCHHFSITHAPDTFQKDADAGWRVEITPLKVVDDVVTFRLRWTREIDRTAGPARVGEDIEVTLKPGESRPIDSIPVAADARTSLGRPCDLKAVSLRVSADYAQMDRRLIEADIWLVERLPNGKERSQRQSLRGLPHRTMPFYFDGIADGDKRLDIFGKLIADPEQGTIQVGVETAVAHAQAGQSGYQSAQWYRSTLNLKPNEIVEVALRREGEKPPISDGRTFSIRIQTKQIR